MKHLEEKYTIIHSINKGSHSEVFLAKLKSELVALKIYTYDYRQEEKAYESTFLQKYTHQYIIKLIDSHLIEKYIVLEYSPEGDLFDTLFRCQSFSETQAYKLFEKILQGVQFIHSCGWIHCDIKPENILLFRNDNQLIPKIIDFELILPWNSMEFQKSERGSLGYASPELIFSLKFIGPEVDIWSLGSTLYLMVTGVHLINLNKKIDLIHSEYLNYDRSRFKNLKISTECSDLLISMLKFEREDRITIPSIWESSWMKNFRT